MSKARERMSLFREYDEKLREKLLRGTRNRRALRPSDCASEEDYTALEDGTMAAVDVLQRAMSAAANACIEEDRADEERRARILAAMPKQGEMHTHPRYQIPSAFIETPESAEREQQAIMMEIREKIATTGIGSLTLEERRFANIPTSVYIPTPIADGPPLPPLPPRSSPAEDNE